MRRSFDRSLLVTRVYRMCYTSTFGFCLLTLLTVYCDAYNDTGYADTRNVTEPEYRFLVGNNWLNGFKLCRDVYNMTMASVDDIKDITNMTGTMNRNHSTQLDKNSLEKNLPVWTYAFEVTNKTSRKILLMTRSDVDLHKHAYQCSASNVTQELMLNTSRWARINDEQEFLSGSEGLSVHCLLLDENGQLRKENCEAEHKTLCIAGNTQQVVKYVGNITLAPYTPPTTKRDPTGRSSTYTKSSSSPSKQDTNSTHLSTVNIITNPVQDQADIWMDPHIRYSIIAVGSFIVLAILVAVCCCCYRKRHRNRQTKRKSTHLADNYSETADSIAIKETSVYETADTSEYAVPEDALKKALHRESIGENEYDVLSKTSKSQNKFSGNAYNHVTIVPLKDRPSSSNQEENTYDVTNFGKSNTLVLSANDLTGNIYGDFAVKSDR